MIRHGQQKNAAWNIHAAFYLLAKSQRLSHLQFELKAGNVTSGI